MKSHFIENQEGKNVFVLGNFRKYKNLVEKPTILKSSDSFVLTELSGELLEEYVVELEKNGYKIKVFDLINFENMKNRFCYNPFYYIRKDEDVIKLIDLLICKNSIPGPGTYQIKTNETEAALLKALCFYVKKELAEDEQNFSSVLKLLVSAYENEGNGLDMIMDDLKERKPGHIALKYYKVFKTNSGKRKQEMVISCSIRLTPFQATTIKNLTDTDTIDLDSIKNEKTALFCIVNPANTIFNFLVSMLYTQLFEILSSPKNVNDCDYKPLIPVRFLMNDFSKIDLDKKLKIGKQNNISWTFYCHDITILKNDYPDSWMDILKSMDIFLFTDSYKKEMLENYFADLKEKETIIIK